MLFRAFYTAYCTRSKSKKKKSYTLLPGVFHGVYGNKYCNQFCSGIDEIQPTIETVNNNKN